MKTKNFELIELPINANQGVGRVNFPEIQQLRNTTLQAVESYNASHIATSPNGLPLITAANAAVCYLGLFINGRDVIVRMPFINLIRVRSVTGAAAVSPYIDHLQEFDNLQGVDWSKSYIQFAAAPVATAFAVIIGVHYA